MTCMKVSDQGAAEWWRLSTAERITGIRKAKLYDLIARGKIKSACLRDENQSRGTRLIHAETLRAYIEDHCERPSAQDNPSNKTPSEK